MIIIFHSNLVCKQCHWQVVSLSRWAAWECTKCVQQSVYSFCAIKSLLEKFTEFQLIMISKYEKSWKIWGASEKFMKNTGCFGEVALFAVQYDGFLSLHKPERPKLKQWFPYPLDQRIWKWIINNFIFIFLSRETFSLSLCFMPVLYMSVYLFFDIFISLSLSLALSFSLGCWYWA